MTETDISKVIIEGDYATIMGIRYKRVEEPKTPVEEAYKEWWGEYPSTEKSVSETDDIRWAGFQAGYELAQPKAVPVDEPEHYDEIEHDISENVENKTIRDVIDRWWMDTFTSKNQWDVDTCIDDLADQVEFWILRNKKEVPVGEQSKPMDEVVERLVKKYQAQKLWNILSNKYDYISATCDDIVSAVEEWLPKPQNASGSQNVNTELLVEGFNDCVRKMKEMLR
jgi:hypothetical protein